MPANRSRTMKWRQCLQQIQERQGSLEIAVARSYEDVEGGGSHLVWRVRLLELSETELVVEQPIALGQRIRFTDGVALVAIISVGQNRWTFTTEYVGSSTVQVDPRRALPGLRLKMPTSVNRCQRRDHHRMETAALHLPKVDLWPLLDPKSVVVAERANEIQVQREIAEGGGCSAIEPMSQDHVMPEVGPPFDGLLLNLGGGGIGLRVPPEHSQMLARCRVFWTRLDLEPELSTPICASAKLVHTQLRSDQHMYAGFAFDFTFNPGHQHFVAEQICRFIANQQQGQLAAG